MRMRRLGDSPADYRIVAFDARNGSRKEVVRGLVAKYSPTGHLLWVTSDGTLHAQRFDLDRLELTGAVETIATGLAVAGFGVTDLALSPSGDLLYVPGSIRNGFSQLDWVSRDGVKTPLDTSMVDGLVNTMSLSPDGSAIALELLRTADVSSTSRIWVKPSAGGPTQLVTTENRSSWGPIWTPDGRDLLYHSAADGSELYRRRADGSGAPVLLARMKRTGSGMTMLRDGRTLVLTGEVETGQRMELLKFRTGLDSVATPLLASPGGERSPVLSPDGRALAYVSNESGKPEVHVRPFPDVDSRKLQVSVDGGTNPRWNPAGGELFYLSTAGDLIAAPVETSPALKVGRVVRLFTPIGFQGEIGRAHV